MTYPDYIREKAIQMRVEKQLSIVEIAERLALPKTTIYYWVKDIPLQRERSPRRDTPACRARDAANSARFKAKRDAAYQEGVEAYDRLASDPTFRDFICMYVGEGYKRCRNAVSIGNSAPRVVVLAARWIRRLSRNPVHYWVQYHADQDVDELRAFWAGVLGVEPSRIRVQRKSNSNHLSGRTWRSNWGVLTVRATDTYLRARLQAWMDRVQAEWLDLPVSGRGAAW